MTTQDVYAMLQHLPPQIYGERICSYLAKPVVETALSLSPPSVSSDAIRDIVGNPFRPVTLAPSWLTHDVRDLAQTTHDGDPNDAVTWSMLHDALVYAGCNNEDVLRHCLRQQRCAGCLEPTGVYLSFGCDGWTPASLHVRGCWLIELLTGGGGDEFGEFRRDIFLERRMRDMRIILPPEPPIVIHDIT